MESINVIVETERLILRRYVEGDAQDLYEYLSNPEVVKYEPYKPMDPDEVKSNLAWRISTDEMIAVELKSNHKMIGNVYLGKREFDALEMGYVFNQDYWGKGYAKESCKDCFARFYCSGGCSANSYNFSGSINGAYEIGCEMQKKRIECAIMIKAALADEE